MLLDILPEYILVTLAARNLSVYIAHGQSAPAKVGVVWYRLPFAEYFRKYKSKTIQINIIMMPRSMRLVRWSHEVSIMAEWPKNYQFCLMDQQNSERLGIKSWHKNKIISQVFQSWIDYITVNCTRFAFELFTLTACWRWQMTFQWWL